MSDKIIVAGDVHLGSTNANEDDFNRFLDDIHRNRDGVTEVVLLGDLWDLIRCDPFGCAWRTSGTITRIKRLAEHLPVRCILGNHDTYLRALNSSLYNVEFYDEYVFEGVDYSIRFCHGNSFDRFQFDTLSNYLSGPGDRGEIDPTHGLKDPVVTKFREHIQNAKHRLCSIHPAEETMEDTNNVAYPRRERRAHAYLETIPEEKLVYGHTHTPYVHPTNAVANPGSWKSTAPVNNAYLVIGAGHLMLYQYRNSKSDKRIE